MTVTPEREHPATSPGPGAAVNETARSVREPYFAPRDGEGKSPEPLRFYEFLWWYQTRGFFISANTQRFLDHDLFFPTHADLREEPTNFDDLTGLLWRYGSYRYETMEQWRSDAGTARLFWKMFTLERDRLDDTSRVKAAANEFAESHLWKVATEAYRRAS